MTETARELYGRLLASGRYGDIADDALRRVANDCAERYKKPKEREHAAREALHGITGAFMTKADGCTFERFLEQWREERSDEALSAMLSCHASTRERLPLDKARESLETMLMRAGPCERILDFACGIYPLLPGSMGIPTIGVDLSGRAVACVNRFADVSGAPVRAVTGDLLTGLPAELTQTASSAALVLMLKLLPLLERQERGAATRLLGACEAGTIVVSFPTRTLGGRKVGMERHYSQWMESHVPVGRAVKDRFLFGDELFYLLTGG